MKISVVMTSLAVAAFVAPSACVAQMHKQFVNSEQVNLIRSTCQTVMGIGYQNSVVLEACMQSLADTLSAKNEGDMTSRANKDCTQQGLSRGTPAFSTCVIKGQKAYAASWPSAPLTPTGPAAPLTFHSQQEPEGYYGASFDTKRHREQLSCAQIGIGAASPAFGHCVNNLDASLDTIRQR